MLTAGISSLVGGQVHLGVANLGTGVALLVFAAGSSALAVLLTLGLGMPERVSLGLLVAMR